MRPLQDIILAPVISSSNRTSKIIDLRQIVSLSLQAVAGTGACSGTVQLQVSNDPCLTTFQNYTPSNWSNLGSALTFAQTAVASNQLIPKLDSSYVALRAVWNSVPGAVTTVVAVADVAGSLNNTYFLYASNTTAYYVWFNINSAGVDPALSGRTGIQISAATNASASTLGGLMRTGMAVTGVVITGSGATVIATGATASDGAAPTGFSFTPTSNNTSLISLQLSALGL